MTRIEHPSSVASRFTFVGGLLAALLLAVGVVWWTYSRDQNVADKTHPDEFAVPSDGELRRRLTAEQYDVTRRNGTDTPFHNPYWDNQRPGIYVDIITNEPLFSSLDKFDAGTGIPAFTKPISPEHVVEKADTSNDMVRREIRAKKSDSHLGHLFDDGPPPTKLRYSVNSGALRFVPAEKLKAEGFLEFFPLFVQPAATDAAK